MQLKGMYAMVAKVPLYWKDLSRQIVIFHIPGGLFKNMFACFEGWIEYS